MKNKFLFSLFRADWGDPDNVIGIFHASSYEEAKALAEKHPRGQEKPGRIMITQLDELEELNQAGLQMREVVYSMTSLLVAWMRGEAAGIDPQLNLFWFNCCRNHVFPADTSMAPVEVTWASSPAEGELVAIESLTERDQNKFLRFQEMILEAEELGNVSWRCQREGLLEGIQ